MVYQKGKTSIYKFETDICDAGIDTAESQLEYSDSKYGMITLKKGGKWMLMMVERKYKLKMTCMLPVHINCSELFIAVQRWVVTVGEERDLRNYYSCTVKQNLFHCNITCLLPFYVLQNCYTTWLKHSIK